MRLNSFWAAIAAGATVLLIIVAAFPIAGALLIQGASGEVANLERAERTLDGVLVGALTAETGVRGYVLTGEPLLLEPYEQGIEQFETEAALLRELLADDHGDLLATVGSIEAAFEEWRQVAAEPQIEAAQAGDTERAQQLLADGAGIALIETIRADSGELGAAIADQRSAAVSDRDERRLIGGVFMGIGVVAALAGVGLAGALVASRQHARADLAEEEHVSALRGDMLSAASHDLRSPLTGLVLASQVLAVEAGKRDDDDMASLADEITNAARRTALMVADLLDFTRSEAGRLEIQTVPIIPSAVVSEAIADVRLSRPGEAFVVEDHLPPELRIEGDPARLRAAVRNLLENALHYARPPYRVRLEREAAALAIHVEDGGPGVPEGEREAILQRFVRGSTSRGLEGTGIGLFLCSGIARLHGGQLRIDESPLGGADFIVQLPLHESAGSPGA